MKRNILGIIVLILIMMFYQSQSHSIPSNTMDITPIARTGTTISSSDENARNNEISTKFNAHSHTDFTSVSGNTWTIGDGTDGNKDIIMNRSSYDPVIRHNDTLGYWTISDNGSVFSTHSLVTGTVKIKDTQTITGAKTFTNDVVFTSSASVSINASGPVTVSDGSLTAPSIGFTSNTRTGLYRKDVHTLAIVTNGSESASFSPTALSLTVGATTGISQTETAITANLPLLIGDGSAGAPSLALANDPDSGIYSQGAAGLSITFGGTRYYRLDTGSFDPIGTGTGTLSSGSASNYWNDISYKTLTDRGCLGWFDEGVELRDGRIVSDIEALFEIKKHPSKKTVYGVSMLDYRTFPKVAYKPADDKGKLLPRDENDEPYSIDEKGIKLIAADGIEMTSMLSIMIGAIKELHNENMELEKRIKRLETK